MAETEIASLQIKVDTSGVDKSIGSLDKLTAAATKTEKKVKTLSDVFVKNGTEAYTRFEKAVAGSLQSNDALTASMEKNATFLKKTTNEENLLEKAINKATRAYNLQKKSMSGGKPRDMMPNRFNVANVTAQLQDIGVTSAMGMNPATIGLQQGTQLAEAFNSMKDPIAGLKEAIKRLLNPVSLLTISLTTLAAVGIQMVDWSSLAGKAANFLGDCIKALSKAVVFFAAVMGVAAVASLTTANAAMVSLTASFAKMLPLIIASAKAFGALAASTMLTALSAMANPIGIAIVSLFALSAAVVKVREDIGIFSATLRVMKGAINTAIGSIAALTAGMVGFFALFRGMGWKGLNDAVNDAFSADYLGDFAKSLSRTGDAVKHMFDKDIVPKENPWGDFVKGVEKDMRALEQQKELLFLVGEEAAVASKKIELLSKAEEAMGTLTKDQRNSILSYGEALGKMSHKYESLESKIQFANSTTSGFFKDMKNSLMQGENAWEAFGKAVTNVIDSILDALIDVGAEMLVRSIGGQIAKSNPTAGAGAGAKPGLTKNAKGGAYTNGVYRAPTLFKFAKGSRFGLMGEAGPEAVMPLTRSADGSLGVRAVGGGKGGSGVVVNVINNANATARTEERDTPQGPQIDVIIDQIVSEKMSSQGSDTNRALTSFSQMKLISR